MEFVQSEKAPKAVGPYSQAVRTGNLVFCSGQIPLNPATTKIEVFTIEEQTRQVLTNVSNLLAGAGLTLSNVVKSTVFLKDLNDFAQMNAVYTEFFGDHKPARSTIQVARIPLDSLVEIECIAEAK